MLFGFKEEPLSSDPDFDNTYKGGISIDTNGGITLTCTSAGWGNSGAWNDTPIPNNGSISAKPNKVR
jgi:hypothetical protein